jgi:2-(1,2-epoxy-1,2-dihydrophenyl)acetyl-CoA isomerase
MTPPSAPDQPTTPDVLVEHDRGITTVTLDRPGRKNAITGDMIRTIIDTVRSASTDDVTRVLVFRSGIDDFCSGIDLVESNAPKAPNAETAKPRTGHLERRLGAGAHQMILTLADAQLPIVAAVNGWAVGIGMMLALSADVTIATPSAKFWVPMVTKGFTPDSGSSWLLPRLVGLARAKEMLLRGKPVDGERAAEWGLVSRCVPADELDAAVAEVAEEMAAAATVSVGLARVLLHHNLSTTLEAAIHSEAMYAELSVRSDDFKEGMRAFREKRPVEYTGW